AEQTADEFNRGVRGAAPLVEERVELHDIDGTDQPAIMQHLHDQVRLAIGRAAWHGGADAGRQSRVEKVDVETDMQHAVARPHPVDHAADQHPDPELVDLPHVSQADAAISQQILFQSVDRTYAE